MSLEQLAMRLRRVSWPLRMQVGSLGVPGLLLLAVGIALLGWQIARRPAIDATVDELRQQALALATQAPTKIAPREQSDEQVFESLPSIRAHAADLRALFEAARTNKLTIERSDFQVTPAGGPITVVTATLPMRGSYANIKQFASEALERLPHLSLQDLRLERPDIGTTELRARVRVALYYSKVAP